MKEIIAETESLCPYCLVKIPAYYIEVGGQIFLYKECPEHGAFQTLFWRDAEMYHKWKAQSEHAENQLNGNAVNHGCPYDCGVCAQHEGGVCTAVLEITYRCNLDCRVCFADASKTAYEPDLSTIEEMYKTARRIGGQCSIQISGGEPTVREDLPEIIKMGKEMEFPHIQVNTNGVRLAASPDYALQLKEAGADLIYLQFDSLDDSVYEQIRGKKLLNVKKAAIDNCKKAKLGVLLVPTVIPGLNLEQIGSIIGFAKEWMPTVKGIHFQPVSYFGRYHNMATDDDRRSSLCDVVHEIERQTGGEIRMDQLVPRRRFDAHCAFSGVFYLKENGMLAGITRDEPVGSDGGGDYAAKANRFTNAHWRLHDDKESPSTDDPMKHFQERLRNYSLSITGMGFQDAWNIDIGRLKGCCVHVISSSGNSVPLCAFHLTSVTGKRLYQNE